MGWGRKSAVVACVILVVGCSAGREAEPLRLLTNDPAFEVHPRGGSLVDSVDEFSCRDRFDGKQPQRIRSYSVGSGTPRGAIESMLTELIALGWVQRDPAFTSVVKTVGGEEVLLSLEEFNGKVFVTASVRSVDYCS